MFQNRRLLIIGCSLLTMTVAAVVLLSLMSASVTYAQGTPTATNCAPVEAYATNGRVHVKCAQAVSGIAYFAYPTSDSVTANRYLDMITSAIDFKKSLVVWYDLADTSGAGFGCLTTDCRVIKALAVES